MPGHHSHRPFATEIVALEAMPLTLKLTAPFSISGGGVQQADLLVVRVRLADGSVGFGEAAPLPPYNGETVAQAIQSFEAVRSCLVGADARSWRRIAHWLHRKARASASCRCAIEVALCDALARHAQQPLHLFFGGWHEFDGTAPERAAAEHRGGSFELESDVTIPIVPPEEARRQAAHYAGNGFGRLKLKVGAPNDLERAIAVHEAAPHATLLLDANGGLRWPEAFELVSALRARGAARLVFEQPVPRGDWEGLEALSERGVQLAFDESVHSPEDALAIARRFGAPHLVNIKLMKSGVAQALDIVAIARSAGLGLMVGGMLESNLAMSVSACFAAAQGPAEWLDLDTPLFIADSPFAGGMTMRGSVLDLSSIVHGHGVHLPGWS